MKNIGLVVNFFLTTLVMVCCSKNNLNYGNYISNKKTYKQIVTIKKDSIFEYYHDGYMYYENSYGNWKKDNNFLYLKSFDKFKSLCIDQVYNDSMFLFKDRSKIRFINNSKRDSIDLSHINVKINNKILNPNKNGIIEFNEAFDSINITYKNIDDFGTLYGKQYIYLVYAINDGNCDDDITKYFNKKFKVRGKKLIDEEGNVYKYTPSTLSSAKSPAFGAK